MNERNEGMQGDDDAVMRAARELPQEVAPARDLWPGIEAAISARPARRGWEWHRLAAQAAAVVLLVGGSSGITWLALEEGGGAPGAGPEEPLQFETVAGNFGSRYHLGPEFVDARASLASGLDAKLGQLPPETRAEVEKNIADIRAAIGEINQALTDQPDSALLQELLLDAYREELTLMKKVDTIARSTAMHRSDI